MIRIVLFAAAGLAQAAVITVGTVCDGTCDFANTQLQAAINAAKGGDILELSAGEEFRAGADPYFLRQHAGPPITLRSNRWRNLTLNRRVFPADAPNLAKVCTPSTINQGVFKTDPKTFPVSGWNFKALWITVCGPGQQNAGDLVILGDQTAEKRRDQVSHHFVLDQVLITGYDDYDPGPKRGLLINAGSVEVRDSYIGNIKGTVTDGSETHGLGGWVTNGLTITNSRISSGSENFLFGGARVQWPGQTSTNIELVGSLLEKDLDWQYFNWPHAPVESALPTCFAAPQTVQVADKMYICNGAGKWFRLNWSPDRQPACLSDETGGVHWRDTSSFPSKTWDCLGGKWVPGAGDRMHPVLRTATDVVEGAATKIVSTAGISNVDWNNGTWVVISGVTGACAAINKPWQIQATGGNSITVGFDSSGCGAIPPAEVHMQFQFSNWDTKNGGEFKNTLGAHVRGNVFRNCLFPVWQNQKCRAFLLNLTSEQDGPTSTLAEIAFVNNKFYHATGGIEEGAIICDANNIVYAAKIVRGKPTQLLDSACSFIVGDNITVTGAPTTGAWAALNGTHSVIGIGSPGFGGDAFIELDSTGFPAPNFNVSVAMDLAALGVNRRPRAIRIENNIFKMGHPSTITGGYIGGAKQFTSSSSSTYWYSLDIGRMAIAPFHTQYIHNTVAKPEYGIGYSLHTSLITFAVPGFDRPQYINLDNIWEGNTIIGYNSESPCTKAMEVYARLPMYARGNVATMGGVGNPPTSGYDKYGCEGFAWEQDRPEVGFTDYYADNFRLAPSSKYKGKASDGSDPGADQNVVEWETAEAITGNYNPYLTMHIKSITATDTAATIDYIGYDTSPCVVAIAERRNFVTDLAGTQPAHDRIGRRGSVKVSGLQTGTNYWMRLTCAGRYRDRNFATL